MKVLPPNRKQKWEKLLELNKSGINDKEVEKLLEKYKKQYPSHIIIRTFEPISFEPIIKDLDLK